MTDYKKTPKTGDDLLRFLDGADLKANRRRDLKSAIKRICDMAHVAPAALSIDPVALRSILRTVRPAAHGMTQKTWSNVRSLLGSTLQLAGVADPMGRGLAQQSLAWSSLLHPIRDNKRLSHGLAAFANWCAGADISPDEVDDETVQRFATWIQTRTLCPNPRDVVRRVPTLWNEASEKIEAWPKTKLTIISFKSPFKRVRWNDLNESFRRDADVYLAMRAGPDLFDERPNAPRRPLAPSTLRQQREHLRLAASVLVEGGVPMSDIASLADLVKPDRFKSILRYYHEQANRQPNAFVICVAKTLIQTAQYHVGVPADAVAQLKVIAAKLPPVPFDLTAKNKSLARQFESEDLRAKLLFLPEQVMTEVARDLAQERIRYVEAQVAIAIDINLVMPLRPQNLSSLIWQRHFSEPDGPKGRLLLHIPAQETKSKLQDLVAEIPNDVGKRLRWYRRHILPRLTADMNGPLFVTKRGHAKTQETLSKQIVQVIRRRLGVHLTPHQTRHLAAIWYLDEHPEDFETPRAFLGHAWSKTTRVYAGSSTRRASRAYGNFLLQQREGLKLKSKRPRRRNGGSA
ncbi:MAG: tyrosine-type recombinase/integrase [Hyphomicrobiales bacterium]